MSSKCFETEGSKHVEGIKKLKIKILILETNNLPEDKHLGSKYVEDIKKLKYEFRKCAFRWFIVYNSITIHSEKKKYLILLLTFWRQNYFF